MTESTNKDRAGLYRKIATVTAAVSRIPKNGRNSFHNYTYATESDITDGLRDLLAENGLAFLPPSVISWERNDTVKKNGERGDDLTRVQLQFSLACTESGEVFSAFFWGEGQDGGDKGFYKAYTGAVKYFLMKTFLIATGDDPERDDGPPTGKAPERKTSSAPTAERTQAPPPRAEGGSRTAPAPARETNGVSPLQEKRAQLAALRTDALRAGHKWNPPKSPGDMSQLEVEAAINELERLMGAKLAHAVPTPSEKAALAD